MSDRMSPYIGTLDEPKFVVHFFVISYIPKILQNALFCAHRKQSLRLEEFFIKCWLGCQKVQPNQYVLQGNCSPCHPSMRSG